MSFHHSPKIVADGLVFYVNPSSKKCIDKSFTGSIVNDTVKDLTNKNRIESKELWFDSQDKSFLMNTNNGLLSFYRDFTNISGKVTYMCSFYLPPASAFNFGTDIPFILSSYDSARGFIIYFDAADVPNSYIKFFISMPSGDTATVSSYALAQDNPSNFNKIYTVVGTLDNGVMKFYVNGLLVDSLIDNNVAAAVSANYIDIGSSSEEGYPTNALIKVYSSMIYDRALTDVEVLQNYNALKGRYKA
jgi:hypothetical protein